MLEHSIGDLAIHFVTWILGGRNLLIHYKCAISGRRKGGDCVIAIVRQFLLLVLLESLDDFHMSS